MGSFYISVVSHNHEQLIMDNFELYNLSKLENVHVCIKDNVGSSSLKLYCDKVGFHYLSNPLSIGFGENNNVVYDFFSKLGMSSDDFFCVINPDVVVTKENFQLMMNEISGSSMKLFTINLFKDEDFSINEPSLRYFPTWQSFFRLFLNKPANLEYDKSLLKDYDEVDWAAGSFLVFNVNLYNNLNGFSDKYFMYYEDVDICYRAKNSYNHSVCFLKSVKAIHDGAYANRNIFSKHFFWYMKSFLTFLMSK